MKHTTAIAVLAALASAAASGARGSGVGLHHRNPARALQTHHACPTGDCGPNAACSGCGPRAFAGVDGETPPPCAAEGACIPKRSTFGFYQTNWRRWPGDTDAARPALDEATADDELLAPFDAPPPEREDQQAPPPIEEDPNATLDEPQDDLPPLDIDLPPLPERRPFGRPFEAPPEEGDDPPALPFGAVDTPGPTIGWRPNEPSTTDAASDLIRRLPALPPELTDESPTPRTAVRGEDTPPPLPGGFTLIRSPRRADRAPALPTLGRPRTRFDAAIRPASAVGPTTAAGAR